MREEHDVAACLGRDQLADAGERAQDPPLREQHHERGEHAEGSDVVGGHQGVEVVVGVADLALGANEQQEEEGVGDDASEELDPRDYHQNGIDERRYLENRVVHGGICTDDIHCAVDRTW